MAPLARESAPLDTDHCPGVVELSLKVGSGGGIGINGELQAKTMTNEAATTSPASHVNSRILSPVRSIDPLQLVNARSGPAESSQEVEPLAWRLPTE
jgi:hypothetical protein